MFECYFDTEIAYTDDELVEKLREGKRVPIDLDKMKIITVQYQLINKDGTPHGPLRIFREWKSSEEQIIRQFAPMLSPQRLWDFIFVGYNINFDLGVFRKRAELYGINMDDWFVYHEIPNIDVKHICVAMNEFRFKNSGLDKFTGKEHSGAIIPVWYKDKKYDKIIDYVEKETAEFVKFYEILKRHAPSFRKPIEAEYAEPKKKEMIE